MIKKRLRKTFADFTEKQKLRVKNKKTSGSVPKVGRTAPKVFSLFLRVALSSPLLGLRIATLVKKLNIALPRS